MKRAKYSTPYFPLPALAALLLAALLLRGVAAIAPSSVERLYAQRLYPALARGLGLLTGGLPFSLAEVTLGCAVALAGWRCVRFARRLQRSRGRRARALLAGTANLAAWIAGAYLAFLLLWGLNYQRESFAVAAGLGPAAITASAEELTGLAEELVARTNATRITVGEDARGRLALVGGVAGALARAGSGVRAAADAYAPLRGPFGTPKPVLLSAGLSHLGISGVFFPFTGEANVNATLPAAQVPFTATHELAHQGGFAREDEANYLAWVACRLHGDADFRYSGALNAALYVLRELRGVDAPRHATLSARLSPAVQRDLDALREWSERYRGRAQEVSRKVNDAYLKAQGEPEGVRSYGRMVDLLILERRLAAERGAALGQVSP
jgi:hypothetical protein